MSQVGLTKHNDMDHSIIMSRSDKSWSTKKKLPFWLRRVDVPVQGQAAAEQRTQFNWPLVYVPAYALGAALVVTTIVLILGGIVGVAVSFVKAFPVISAFALLALLFKRS